MAEQISINFEKKEFLFEKEAAKWQLSLKQSEVEVQEAKELLLLEMAEPKLLPCKVSWQEDSVDFTYQIERDDQSFYQVKHLPKAEKIRAAWNLLTVQNLLSLPLTFFIAPENIVFDRNLQPKIAYRGLKGKMSPKDLDTDGLLRQYQALVIALFEEKVSFEELYDGQLEIFKGSEFATTIQQAKDFNAIEAYLADLYQKTVSYNQKTFRTVKKRNYRIFQQASIWVSALAVLLLIPLAYFLFFKVPFQDKMLATDTSFLKKDYDTVISKLETVKTNKIPYTQKYELAYSVVQGATLTEKQKTAIYNNLSLKSSEDYLTYWVNIGRGDFDDALDIAKNLEESDLILYGIAQKIEQVRSSSKLTGSEKEEKITKLQEDYKKYQDERNKSIQESSTDSSTSTKETTSQTTSGGK